ncbi:hypothetical protein ICHIJ1_20420 [Fluviibacter phosphoraccumulans]|uniref:Excisionase n=1 Tax=Fluviibacter phosphoraccumulans TaxID=1751046 RepID=A0A7R6TP62_9RHOO|nr:hypothetical protein [Fluviibacter phosphoraccumulans]BBU68724.1 hypothetical protein ICHIAU1_10070 [Fluviibacter phosphoraccumulans]BBU72123.1 hypothetical protein ICHIJ1_20420 [Fluviibacter phosphoraccumulans]
MRQNLYDTPHLTWVRAERYCELSGEPLSTIRNRVSQGIWVQNLHFKRITERALVVNLDAITDWFNHQPHFTTRHEMREG